MSVLGDVAAVQRRIDRIDASPALARARATDARAPAPFPSLVVRETERLVRASARAAGVDAALASAVARTESGFRPNATSPAGAAGVMQLMPATAAALGVVDRYDAVQNVRGGVAYLRELLHRFGGNVPVAVAAYDAGPAAIERFGGVPPFAETRAYVGRVMAAYREARER